MQFVSIGLAFTVAIVTVTSSCMENVFILEIEGVVNLFSRFIFGGFKYMQWRDLADNYANFHDMCQYNSASSSKEVIVSVTKVQYIVTVQL